MGAAIGAGAGAVGGTLIGDHLDNKREEQEKAEIYRHHDLEKHPPQPKKKIIQKDTPTKGSLRYPKDTCHQLANAGFGIQEDLPDINHHRKVARNLKEMFHKELGL